MKKIKLLNYLLVALLLFYILEFCSRVYYISTDIAKESFEEAYKLGVFGHYQPLIETFFILLFLIGLLFVQQGIFQLIKKGAFNPKSNSLFRKGGLLFVISGLCNFFISLEPFFIFEKLNFISTFPKYYFLVFLVGLGLLLIADLLEDGTLLKQENDLTI